MRSEFPNRHAHSSLLLIMFFVAVISANASRADRVDDNLQMLLQAARQLEWADDSPSKSAYLIVKMQTIKSPVALVFGYFDNFQACRELVDDLNVQVSLRSSGSNSELYVCEAVY